MAITTTIDSVTTEDAVPATAPHKISAIATKTLVTVLFTPATSDSSPIKAWRVTFNGNRKNGRREASLGVVCGIDRVGGPGARLLSCTQGVQRSAAWNYVDTGSPADGGYTVEVVAYSATLGVG